MHAKQLTVALSGLAILLTTSLSQANYRYYPASIERNELTKNSRSLYHKNMQNRQFQSKRHYHSYAVERQRKAHTVYPHNRYYAKSRWIGRYNHIPIEAGLHHNQIRYHWSYAHGGNVPFGAVISGYRHNYPYYICRASVGNKTMPGKLFAGRGCYVKTGNDMVVRSQYIVLSR